MEGAGILSSSHHLNFCLFVSYLFERSHSRAATIRSGIRMIPKQETITMF